jgi:hypothetical protein
VTTDICISDITHYGVTNTTAIQAKHLIIPYKKCISGKIKKCQKKSAVSGKINLSKKTKSDTERIDL